MNNDKTDANSGGKKGLGNIAYLSPLAVIALSFGYAVGWGSFVLPGAMFLPNAGPAGSTVGFLIGTVAIVVLAYDFVLMDVMMPVMDGYEATSIIRKLPDGDKLKILAFSANAFEEDREKSLKAGMDGHIAKPLKVNELLSELKRFVE